MRKVSFFLLRIGVVCAAACAAAPLRSWAQDAAVGERAVTGQAITLHPRKHLRHARFRHGAEGMAAVAMTRRPHPVALAQAGPGPTQPDIAAPPPVPPRAERADRKVVGAGRSGEMARLNDSKAAPGGAETNGKEAQATAEKHAELVALPPDVRQFCASTANAAADARIAWQAARLTELAAKLRQRIAELEVKRAEYEDWLHRHDEAMKEAKEDVVAIYSRMRPDSAAAQLAAMDEVMAASLLAKLNSRVASAILAEMDPTRAARITNAMVGPIDVANGKKS